MWEYLLKDFCSSPPNRVPDIKFNKWRIIIDYYHIVIDYAYESSRSNNYCNMQLENTIDWALYKIPITSLFYDPMIQTYIFL